MKHVIWKFNSTGNNNKNDYLTYLISLHHCNYLPKRNILNNI